MMLSVKDSKSTEIFFDMQENVKKTFDQKQIGIPYPQMDVHVNNQ